MDIKELFQSLISQKTTRKLYARLREDHIKDESFAARDFTPGGSYFQVRLSEMFLKDRREYWQGYVPLGIVVSDFIYDGERRTIPFVVGNQVLKGIEKYIDKEYVEYLNTRIVGPVPYMGDGIALFVGLFRTQVTNLAEKLFNVVETLLGAFDATQLSKYLDIAKPLSKGLSDLLGMQEVELRVGNRDEFSDMTQDSKAFREGYLAYLNCPEDRFSTEDLWVKDGRLFVGTEETALAPLKACDYCLVRIEHLSERTDYTTLPFHGKWAKAQESIFEGNLAKARSLFMELVGMVAGSPDLTRDHRYHLIQAYKANFELELGIYNEISGKSGEVRGVATRGALRLGARSLDPKTSIQYTAQKAQEAGVSKEAVQGLFDISRNWEEIPGLSGRPQKTELNDTLLEIQLKAMQTISRVVSPDPQGLADAIIAGTIGMGYT